MPLSIQHPCWSAQAPCKAKGSSPCLPVVSRWVVCPLQGPTLPAVRPVASSRVAEVSLQSREDTGVASVEPLGSMEWYSAADPQPRYMVLQSSGSQHGSHSTRSPYIPAVAQATANNIVSIRTTTDVMDVTALEREIGLLKQKVCNTRNLEQLRGARIQALQAAIVSQGLTLPSKAMTMAAASSTAYQQRVEELRRHPGSLSSKYQTLQQENEALMARCRTLSTQVQALEAVLLKSGVPLPRRSLASVSLSSYSPASSVASTGSVGDDDAAVSTITFAAAAQAPKPPRKHTVKCHFEVKCDASPGDRIWIVGNDPALGSWDIDCGKALLLQRSDGNCWTGDLSVEWDQWEYYSPRMMAFKAVRQRIDGRLESQQGHNLEILVGPSMGHHVHPCVASWEFDSCNSSDKPLNFKEACLATYHINYNSDVPEVVAKKRAQDDVEKCIQQLRGNVLAAC